MQETLEGASGAFELLEGVPTSEHLRGVGWRSPNAPDVESIRRAGLMWFSPVLPMTASAANDVVAQVEALSSQHGFDALMTLSAVSSRAMCCVISIHYAKSDATETTRAQPFCRALSEELGSSGYLPYRTRPTTTPSPLISTELTSLGVDFGRAPEREADRVAARSL